ncbi:MAG: hypothetical protein ABEK59_11445, partial [Halobacteria archaeon]
MDRRDALLQFAGPCAPASFEAVPAGLQKGPPLGISWSVGLPLERSEKMRIIDLLFEGLNRNF